jgi:hypothetical protein
MESVYHIITIRVIEISWAHVWRLHSRYLGTGYDKYDEHEFLFRIQIVAYMSNLGRLLRGQWNRLVECVLQLDRHLGGLGLMHDWVWGTRLRPASTLGALQMPSVYRLSHNSPCRSQKPA